MSNINVVVVAGRATKDPEVRATASGTTVMTFGLASNEGRKNQHTGQWEDYTNFIDCTMYGKRADSLANIIKKGMKLTVHGRLHYSQWEKDGQKRSKLEVIANEIELPPSKAASQEEPTAQSTPQYPVQQTDPYSSVYDDEIPF